MDIRKLLLRPAGMFSNVNEVVQQLHLAEAGGYEFFIDWSASCYKDEKRDLDPWLYYFEPCFHIPKMSPNSVPILIGGKAVACSKDNIITPRLNEGKTDSLLLPGDRHQVNRIIRQYIQINNDVSSAIVSFQKKYFSGFIIGLHIRGPGRVDGGTPNLRKNFSEEGGVAFPPYLKEVDRVLDNYPKAKIFVCSDSSAVIDKINNLYGDRIITYNATRSTFGEMHANHKENGGLSFDKYKLGLDVVIEAYLLSKTNYFIHGNSNVANFVLCNAPNLDNHYVYHSVPF